MPEPEPLRVPAEVMPVARTLAGPSWCGASTRTWHNNPAPWVGPCVLRHGHDGPVHQDADGSQWTDPQPATEAASAAYCPPTLRDQIAEALPCPVCGVKAGTTCLRARDDNTVPHVTRLQLADAVMPAVQAALTEQSGILTHLLRKTEDELHEQTQRAEKAERRLAELESALNWQTSCLSCSRLLDASYADHARAEQAEDTLRILNQKADTEPS